MLVERELGADLDRKRLVADSLLNWVAIITISSKADNGTSFGYRLIFKVVLMKQTAITAPNLMV